MVSVGPVIVSVTNPVGATPVPEAGVTVITAGAPSTDAFVTLNAVLEFVRDTPTPTTLITGEFAAPDWAWRAPMRVSSSPGPGLKVTVAEQVAPTASGAAQVVDVTLKSEVLLNPVKLNGAFPTFKSVAVAVAVPVGLVNVPRLSEAFALRRFTSSAVASVMYTSSVESIATDVGLVTVGAIMTWSAVVNVPPTFGMRMVPPGIAT
jgi:hypothetical protein